MKQAGQIFSRFTESHTYDDSKKNAKNIAQQLAEYSSLRIMEELKKAGKEIVSSKPVHYRNSVEVEIRYTE